MAKIHRGVEDPIYFITGVSTEEEARAAFATDDMAPELRITKVTLGLFRIVPVAPRTVAYDDGVRWYYLPVEHPGRGVFRAAEVWWEYDDEAVAR